jgi:hypothetical protein
MVGFVQVGKAQTTYTWTGNIDNSWIDPGNWSPGTSTGGVGPTTGDNVIFDASSYNVFCFTNFSVSVNNFTIQNATNDLDIIFGVGSNLTVAGNFSMSSGNFTAPADMLVKGNFSITGGTFTHNNGLVRLQDNTSATLTISSNLASFYDLTVSKNITRAGTESLNVANNLLVSGGSFNTSNGSIITKNFTQSSTSIFTAPNSSNIMRISGDIAIDANATFQHNNGIVELSGVGGSLVVNGTNNFFYDLKINKTGTCYLNSTIVALGLLEFINGALIHIGSVSAENGNVIYARGNVRLYDTYDGSVGNSSRLIFDGTTDQLFQPSGNGMCTYLGNIQINKNDGNVIISSSGTNTLSIDSASFIFTNAKAELQGEFVIGADANISGHNGSRYFVTTGTGKLTRKTSTSPTTLIYPVGVYGWYAPIDLALGSSATMSIAYTNTPATYIQDYTINPSADIVRRSAKEMWIFSTPAPTAFAPYLHMIDTGYSGITDTQEGNVSIAILPTGATTWSNFNSDILPGDAFNGIPIKAYALTPLTHTSGYFTFGSKVLTAHFLGTYHFNTYKITNCKDAIGLIENNTAHSTVEVVEAVSGGVSVGCAVTPLQAQWYEFTNTGTEKVLYFNAIEPNTYLEVFKGTCGSLISVFCQNIPANSTYYLPITNEVNSYKVRIFSTVANGTVNAPARLGYLRLLPKPEVSVMSYQNFNGNCFSGDQIVVARIGLQSNSLVTELSSLSFPLPSSFVSGDITGNFSLRTDLSSTNPSASFVPNTEVATAPYPTSGNILTFNFTTPQGLPTPASASYENVRYLILWQMFLPTLPLTIL